MAIIGQTISPLSSPDLVLRGLSCHSSVAKGDWVRLDMGIVVKAQADNIQNSDVLGVVEDRSATADVCSVRVGGSSSELFNGLDLTSLYFLSATTPGEMVTIPPSGVGQIILNLGQAVSDKRFLVEKKLRLRRAL